MAVKLFLLGRSGSGKTTAFHYLEMLARDKGWSVTRFRDYTILWEMFQADIRQEKFRPVAHGGFDVIDFSVFNEASRWVEKEVQNYISVAEKEELITIELARDDYSKAMGQFSRNFLSDGYFLFVEADLETCIERIQRRVACSGATDNHFVSETILRSYFGKDNIKYMTTSFKTDYSIEKEVGVIANVGSLQDFINKVDQFAEMVFKQEEYREQRNQEELIGSNLAPVGVAIS